MNSNMTEKDLSIEFQKLKDYSPKGNSQDDRRFGQVAFFASKTDPTEVLLCKEKMVNSIKEASLAVSELQ